MGGLCGVRPYKIGYCSCIECARVPQRTFTYRLTAALRSVFLDLFFRLREAPATMLSVHGIEPLHFAQATRCRSPYFYCILKPIAHHFNQAAPSSLLCHS